MTGKHVTAITCLLSLAMYSTRSGGSGACLYKQLCVLYLDIIVITL